MTTFLFLSVPKRIVNWCVLLKLIDKSFSLFKTVETNASNLNLFHVLCFFLFSISSSAHATYKNSRWFLFVPSHFLSCLRFRNSFGTTSSHKKIQKKRDERSVKEGTTTKINEYETWNCDSVCVYAMHIEMEMCVSEASTIYCICMGIQYAHYSKRKTKRKKEKNTWKDNLLSFVMFEKVL